MNNYNVLINQAMPLVIANKFPDAAKIFDLINLQAIKDSRVTKGAGIAYLYTAQNEKALTSFNLSINTDHNQPDVHNFLGELYKKANQPPLAHKHFSMATELAPNVWQYHYNIALFFIMQNNYSSALSSLIIANNLNGKNINPKVIIALAKTYQNLGDFLSAKKTLEDTITLIPNSSVLYFHLGQVLEDLQLYQQAVNAYEKALAIEPNAEYYESLSLLQLNLSDITTAISTLKSALIKFPRHPALVKIYSNLLFETGHPKPFEHYEITIANSFEPVLVIDYANALINNGNFAQAKDVILKLENKPHFEKDYLLSICRLFKAQKQYDAIVDILRAKPYPFADLEILYIEALIAQGDYLVAERLLAPYLSKFPFDQYYLALYTCILEHTNPEKYEEYCNYSTLAISAELQFPKHYGNIDNFNKIIKEVLEELHVTTKNPLSQSVHGGKQTPGNLFNKNINVIKELKQAFLTTFNQAINNKNILQTLAISHPLKQQLSTNIDFSAAWSIWLSSAGFHQSHIHTKGWFSSAYYVDCPKEINESTYAGYLHFGVPSLTPFSENKVKHWIKPEAGILAMFPSYFWHGTVAFESQSPRVVVAADFKPK